MVIEFKQEQKSLYEIDYNLWVLETIKKLEDRDFYAVDWDNLIEEVADLSRRDKRKLESLLTRLFEHLLKLKYWESEKQYNSNHWRREILNFRKQINRLLKESPSLKNFCQQVLVECYQDSRELVSTLSQLPLDTFPEKPIADLEQVLDQNWLP